MSRDGVALEGATVTLEGIGSVNTDADGLFAFRDVPPGNYRLTVNKEGFPDEKRLVPVQTGRANTVQIILAGTGPLPARAETVSVPIQRQGSAILVGGRVNGLVETLFLVDTGATFCVLTNATAGRLGLTSSAFARTVTVHTASGTIEAPLISIDLIEVAGAKARSVEAVIHDVPGLSSAVGGLLGLSFLNRFKVQLDPARGMMLLNR
jgi:clan AA aspartic protease (TIGR02281 family)